MSTQGSYLKTIADAIRTKEGSTAAIPAKNFASRIRGLPVGIRLNSATVATQTTQAGYLTTIADAIRAKEGSTGDIPSNTFVERILALKDSVPTTWSSGTLPVSAGAVAYGSGKFVVVGNMALPAYSSDGNTWTKLSISAGTRLNDVAYGNSKFVITSLCDSYSACSKDAVNWSVNANMPHDTSNPADGYGQRIIYGNNGFIILPNISHLNTPSKYLNTYLLGDGESGWTKKATLPTSSEWYSGVYGNGKYVILNGSPYLAYSTDASTWRSVSLPDSAKAHFYAFTYGDKFVALGYSSSIAIYSTDGVTWKQTKLPCSGLWEGVAYGAGIYIAVEGKGNSTRALTSTDGITWTEMTLPASTVDGWKSIAYGGGKFVIVSGKTFLCYS